MSYRNVAILLAVAAFGSCVGCASAALYEDPTVGAGDWRVMGVERVDNPDVLAGLARVQADVAECLGVEPGDPPARFYTAAHIFFLHPSGAWHRASGMTRLAQRHLYLVRPRPGRENAAAVTLRHEIIHLLLALPHPEADPFIEQCAPVDWRAR